ncbi:MAG TPA: glycosyltransferase family 4 protein [Gemmataceae bacterium]|nr:glycosyltransferase family 4 protein [Gemmataceae bacterium]
MKILNLIPSLASDGAAAQLALLATGLPRDRFEVQVGLLGDADGLPTSLAAGLVPVTALGWTRLLDPRPLWRLRRLVRDFRPDVIHAWRPGALRALAIAVGRPQARLVVSHPFATARGGEKPSRLDRWLLGRADRVVASGEAEADRCLRAGVPPAKVVVLRPGVASAPLAGTPGARRALLCAGRLEPHKGFREAIWAFDVLRMLYDELRLLLVGDGPDLPRLRRFVARTGAEAVEFVGARPDVPALMSGAEAVWVPSLADGGVRVALEAMAAGRPVVASRLPGLAEVIVEGETGFLVPPGDKIALARQTRLLLDDVALRARMGQAGRERVLREFSAMAAVSAAGALYEELAA